MFKSSFGFVTDAASLGRKFASLSVIIIISIVMVTLLVFNERMSKVIINTSHSSIDEVVPPSGVNSKGNAVPSGRYGNWSSAPPHDGQLLAAGLKGAFALGHLYHFNRPSKPTFSRSLSSHNLLPFSLLPPLDYS